MTRNRKRPEIAARRRHRFTVLSGSYRFLVAMSQEILNELRRLNSARIGSDELSRLAPRKRAQAVKAALEAHHRGTSRCC